MSARQVIEDLAAERRKRGVEVPVEAVDAAARLLEGLWSTAARCRDSRGNPIRPGHYGYDLHLPRVALDVVLAPAGAREQEAKRAANRDRYRQAAKEGARIEP